MDCKVNKIRLVVGEDSFKVIDAKTEELISIMDKGEKALFAIEHTLKALGIETSIEDKRVVRLPTHSNFVQMLKDMYEFSKLSENSKILAADDTRFFLFGYVVYYEVLREDGEIAREVSKEFTIKPSDAVKTTVDVNFPKCVIEPSHIEYMIWGVGEANHRLAYCDKKLLKKLFDE